MHSSFIKVNTPNRTSAKRSAEKHRLMPSHQPSSARKTHRRAASTSKKQNEEFASNLWTERYAPSQHFAETVPSEKSERRREEAARHQLPAWSLPGWSGAKVIQHFAKWLSAAQKAELEGEKAVYYLSAGAGEEARDGSYLWRAHEQVGYRYELLGRLGAGAFGEVVQAYDHKAQEAVAMKIVKARPEHMQLALNEIHILMRVKEADLGAHSHLLRIRDFVVFRKHICIITELLRESLYELMERTGFQPLAPRLLRSVALQLLRGLAFLRQQGILHCDLKPENVLLADRASTRVKIIDFGTSTFASKPRYQYVQSRYYRAPEVILGAAYSFPVDMWSLGCLLAELALGRPLFAGRDEQEQLALILATVGPPCQHFLKGCTKASDFVSAESISRLKRNRGSAQEPTARPLKNLIGDESFLGFLERLLKVDPNERATAWEALRHPWLLEDMSERARQQHVEQVLVEAASSEACCSREQARRGHERRNSELPRGKSGHKRRASEYLPRNK